MFLSSLNPGMFFSISLAVLSLSMHVLFNVPFSFESVSFLPLPAVSRQIPGDPLLRRYLLGYPL